MLLPGKAVAEGSLITAVAPAWYEIITMMENDPGILYRIDPRKLEEIIAGAYDRAGFDEVILTPRSGDFGRDVIAVKRDWLHSDYRSSEGLSSGPFGRRQ